MSAQLTTMYEFVEALRQSVPDEIHPWAQSRTHELLSEMTNAAHDGDTHEVARLSNLIRYRIADELRWEAFKRANTGVRR